MTSDKIYTIDEIKEISRPILSKFDFVDKAYLFGSYARNDADEDSDIDIVIVLKENHSIQDEIHFFGISTHLEFELNKSVDTLTLEEARKIMPRTFERDKVLIYERSN